MPDLRELWPTLSPRERDARVAEALGLKVVQFGLSPEHRVPAIVIDDARSLPVPRYSTSWEHAGPLLDRLAADGWFPRLSPYHSQSLRGLAWIVSGEGIFDGRVRELDSEIPCSSAPEAIALAFCLSREVDRE
jgi:hypothetical protein